jgi:hypothetical protein
MDVEIGTYPGGIVKISHCSGGGAAGSGGATAGQDAGRGIAKIAVAST